MATARLRVSENRRFLVREDGTPFFYLADTAWELCHVLRREEVERYLANRAAKGFTVIQTVALSEFDGLAAPNAYGHTPLRKDSRGLFDPRQPDVRPGADDDYWDHVDHIVDRAGDYGLYLGLLPTWGDKVCKLWGVGPDVFDPYYEGQGLGEAIDRARAYGAFLGRRYGDRTNIIWVLGGDRPADGDEAIWRAMARGIAEGAAGTGETDRALMTYHPYGSQVSSALLHHEPWLDFNMIQSGHGSRDQPNYEMITNDYHKRPAKPTLDGEARYEDHPINWDITRGRFDDYDVRQAAYWAVFAGAAGHTYGHYSIFQFYAPTTPRTPFGNAGAYWYDALDAPGAGDMAHLRALIESRPYLDRVPDQAMIAAGQGTRADHVRATRGQDGAYAFVYIPTGKPATIDMEAISGEIARAWWYDPREGAATLIGEMPAAGTRTFTPPSSGRGHDWVLVLDDASRGFGAVGAPRDASG
jgi:hypothetical protein